MTKLDKFGFALDELSILNIPNSDCKVIGTTCDALSVTNHLVDGLQMWNYLDELSFGGDVMKVIGALESEYNKVTDFGEWLDTSESNILG